MLGEKEVQSNANINQPENTTDIRKIYVDLVAATVSGNKDEAEEIVNQYITAKDAKDNCTLLHLVAKGEGLHDLQLKMLKYLLDNQAGVVDAKRTQGEQKIQDSFYSESGYTPLHYAAEYSKLIVFKMLQDKGAKIDEPTDSGWLPIHLAAAGGKNKTIEHLLNINPAYLDSPDKRGNRPLHWATNESTVKLLLDRSADPAAENEKGFTALHGAALRGSQKICALFLGKNISMLKTKNQEGQTPLDCARKALDNANKTLEEAERKVYNLVETTSYLKNADSQLENENNGTSLSPG